jgi:hypothetical protein
VKIEY